MMHKLFFIFISIFYIKGYVQAQETLIEKKVIYSLEAESTEEARRQAQEKAITEVVEELAADLLGSDRYLKNKNALPQVAKQSARFIPFSKTGVIGTKSNLTTIQVDMKISRNNFRVLLQEKGWLVQGDIQPVILPLVMVTDGLRSKTNRWWVDPRESRDEFLKRIEKLVENSLHNSFFRNGFYVWRPVEQNMIQQVPKALYNTTLSREDMKTLGVFFQAALIIEGKVQILKQVVEIKMSAFLSENGKNVGDISRQFTLNPGPLERTVESKLREVLDGAVQDLSAQIIEAWQKGTLAARTLKLTVNGVGGLKAQEQFREKIRTEFPLIRSARERFFSRDIMTLELETSLTAAELAQQFVKINNSDQKAQAKVINDSEVQLMISGVRK